MEHFISDYTSTCTWFVFWTKGTVSSWLTSYPGTEQTSWMRHSMEKIYHAFMANKEIKPKSENKRLRGMGDFKPYEKQAKTE